MSGNLDLLIRRWFARIAAGAAALVVANAAVYLFGVSRLGALAAQEGESAAKEAAVLAEKEATARSTAAQVARFRSGQQALDTLAREHLKTRGERLTEAQATLEQLAREAGLTPGGIQYSYAVLPRESERTRWSRSYVEVQLRVSLSGSYPQIKKLLADLQASPQFFVVGPPSLSTSGQGAVLLNLNLTASTYFVDGDPPAEAAPAADAKGGAP